MNLLLIALTAFTIQAHADNQFIEEYTPATKTAAYVHECVKTRLESIAQMMQAKGVADYEIGKRSASKSMIASGTLRNTCG